MHCVRNGRAHRVNDMGVHDMGLHSGDVHGMDMPSTSVANAVRFWTGFGSDLSIRTRLDLDPT
jgi:hypothetical protein